MLQSVCKTSTLKGCGKIMRSLCRTPRHRSYATTFVVLLAIITILPAMRFMEDLIRDSFVVTLPENERLSSFALFTS
ncbi:MULTISPECIES: hypothetical protein [Nitrosomonas]|nr:MULTISPECIES: hypothetical protein [Nitrosomonas]MEB2332445.1 hypothetical protein [Nitrosomonas sp.]HBF24140.1 hypothetical protein [Nitrosomonas sp.]